MHIYALFNLVSVNLSKIYIDSEPVNMMEARSICQQHGETWDLAIINLAHEYSYLSDLLRSNCIKNTSFWIGYHYHENDDFVKTSINSRGDYLPLRQDKKTGEILTSVFNYSSMLTKH